MSIRLVYLKLELKRAFMRLPQMAAGAVVLLFLAGTIALFSSRALYGSRVVGKIPVGVILPEEDVLAKKVLSMIGSLDSVNGLCDFRYLDQEDAWEGLENGVLYALMEVPEGLIEGIMDGSNPPVRVVLPQNAGLEAQVFCELTSAGAGILSAAQAGIYAGDQMCRTYELSAQIPQLEEDLNRIFLSYSLPREDYFRHRRVQATGDLDPIHFYGVSAYVLLLLLCAIPVSSYLLPEKPVMRQKLDMAGVGCVMRVLAKTAGLGLLLLTVSAALLIVAAPGYAGFLDVILAIVVLLLLCLGAAAVVALIYRAAGSLMGGIMLLFLTVTAQHFLAGGFLPLVFLPASLQQMAQVLPSKLLMDGAAMLLTAQWELPVFIRLAVLTAAAAGLTMLAEVREG